MPYHCPMRKYRAEIKECLKEEASQNYSRINLIFQPMMILKLVNLSLTDNLILYYSFDNQNYGASKVKDESGFDNNGMIDIGGLLLEEARVVHRPFYGINP
ncbi:hypothetical protein RF11_11228 [Thelohanellus kitauei]|uniref:Uncharacterized protein n=1 Tax=Thelohanellus kitauei TaxID=669202 RepID=A0A0C2JDF3_THEKT|nr:hypothetical protein RF11_11228 [Thelohanellus kitauei]